MIIAQPKVQPKAINKPAVRSGALQSQPGIKTGMALVIHLRLTC